MVLSSGMKGSSLGILQLCNSLLKHRRSICCGTGPLKIVSPKRQAVGIPIFIEYYLCGRLYVKDLGKQNRHGLCLQGIYNLMGETGIKQVKILKQAMTFCVSRAGKRKNRCYEKVADVHFGGIREDISED